MALETRGRVHDVAGGAVLDAAPSTDRPHHDKAGLDADPDAEGLRVVLASDRLGVLGGPPLDLEPSKDGPLDVVLVRHRCAEEGQNAVAGDILHGSAEPFDDLDHVPDSYPDDLPDVLGVEPFAERGRAGHVGEQCRDRSTFLAHRTLRSAHIRRLLPVAGGLSWPAGRSPCHRRAPVAPLRHEREEVVLLA